MPNIDSSFIIEDDAPMQEPAGFKKANVGVTAKKSTAWIKWLFLGCLVVAGGWMAYSSRGPNFTLRESGSGVRLSLPDLGWNVTIPKGWTAERGVTKEEIVAYPTSLKDSRSAVRANTYVKFSWSASNRDAKAAFPDAASDAVDASADEETLNLGADGRIAATRADLPAGGRIFTFIDGTPAILIMAPKPIDELNGILESFSRS